MRLLVFLAIAFQFLTAASTDVEMRDDTSAFVTVSNGQFECGDKPLRFYGTNAYWLHMLSDNDLELTLHDIAAANFTVVRTWAFNDVTHQPATGAYFQILKDGSASINDGPDGLQRLDKVVKTAEKFGLKLLFTLTNNWNPEKPETDISFRRRSNDVLPRAFLSNDYGGIDLYNRVFSPSNPTHDLFYTKPEIINAFKNYLSHVIPRYADHSTILGWEIGNDLRCSSTLPASQACNTKTITTWVADIASHIKKLDPHHLVTAGDGGFYCTNCPKIYQQQHSKRDNSPAGPSFDGSYGIDTEDIISIPSIDFGSFQLFPDQVHYFLGNKSDFATTAIAHGSGWVEAHSVTATKLWKPVALTGFALVTKDHFPLFVPFSESARRPNASGGVEQFQADFAFVSWATIALNGNVGGVLEFQWLQNGLLDIHGKRDPGTSPQDGNSHYVTPFSQQNANQAQAGATSPFPGATCS